MIEFRLLWKERVPGLIGLQTFSGKPTTDLQTVRDEFEACRVMAHRHSPFIELRPASSDPWLAPNESSIPPVRENKH